MSKFKLPITHIDQDNWAEYLAQHLGTYEIDYKGISPEIILQQEAVLGVALPAEMRDYYLHFGATKSHDFMYGLQEIDQIHTFPPEAESFPSCSFAPSELAGMAAFALSPANEPLCFDKTSGAIFLLSHDPLTKGKVFTDFSQYLVYELIELEKLAGDGISEDEEINLYTKYLAGEGIDYSLRRLKL